MKQNSSILFHSMGKSLKNRFHVALFAVGLCFFASASASDKPEYLASFDPAKGFKPAQRDLTEIFLQLAGSLEYYGSPVPYLRHVQQENARIAGLHQEKYGHPPKVFRPAYMTDKYLDRFAANWETLSPKLGLESYTKEVGNTMRDAIVGTRGTGTIIVEILNEHQARVFNAMAGKSTKGADFETLRLQFVKRLELDKKSVDEEKYQIPRRDAISFALAIHGITMKLFKRLDDGLNPADADRVKTVITSMFMDVGEMAQSELEAGISEWAINQSSTANR